MNLTVYTDGASRGNPGKSGAGVLILDENENKTAALNRYLGIATNNEAEYKALIIALEYISALPKAAEIDGIIFLLDSQLLVNQMNGVYSVKSPNILPLYHKARKLLESVKEVSKSGKNSIQVKFRHIPRELNKEADKLANLAIDTA
ncbi:MAG: ribonuclease HI family protein [bacterium]